MLTEDTKNAFLCIESVDENRSDDLDKALNELAELVEKNLGGTYSISILDIKNKGILID
jgi:DNA/RNA-binding domain of Phe-tRNA-synthetase-like protein